MDLFRRVVQNISYPTFNEKEEKLHEHVDVVDETVNKEEIK